MKFKTIAEAFNYYRNATLEEIERRAAEIKGTIETDAEADITTLNIELSGLAQAKENIQQQAAFYLGYYQQTQQRYHKADKNTNDNKEEFDDE